ncbi:MAG TPA: DnaJ domain-containing protein [Armatimonadota bacterium]|nr:DnaJ domain-containing protein [Armatimonadota bacterium]
MQRFDPSIDYYEILQVHPNAHREVIKRAYRTILGLLQSHPDLGGTHEEAVRLNEAYRVLSHEETRKAYDDARQQLTSTPLGNNAAKITAAQTYAGNARHTDTPVNSSPGQRNAVVIRCTHCGARNRMVITRANSIAVCGKCHHRLHDPQSLQQTHTATQGMIHLTTSSTEQLNATGEVLLKQLSPHSQHYACLRCHHRWPKTSASFPDVCPHCHSPQWNEFRLFQCRFCSYRFTSHNITDAPYNLFPHCPSCHQHHWHEGSERHTLRSIFRKFIR